MRKRSLKLGDIYEIPLPNGLNAYGRLYREHTLAMYKQQCKDISQLSLEGEYIFSVGVYTDLLHDGEWQVVGNKPFLAGENEWRPTQYIKGKLDGSYSLYIRGEIIPATKEECIGLEAVAAWDRHHVVDRLMGDDKWTNICL